MSSSSRNMASTLLNPSYNDDESICLIESSVNTLQTWCKFIVDSIKQSIEGINKHEQAVLLLATLGGMEAGRRIQNTLNYIPMMILIQKETKLLDGMIVAAMESPIIQTSNLEEKIFATLPIALTLVILFSITSYIPLKWGSRKH